MAEQLCRALASAHAEGIVHCDVKPANVLLSAGGKVKVGRLRRGPTRRGHLAGAVGDGRRHSSVHVARAGPRPAHDLGHGRLQRGDRAVRDARRRAAVRAAVRLSSLACAIFRTTRRRSRGRFRRRCARWSSGRSPRIRPTAIATARAMAEALCAPTLDGEPESDSADRRRR